MTVADFFQFESDVVSHLIKKLDIVLVGQPIYEDEVVCYRREYVNCRSVCVG